MVNFNSRWTVKECIKYYTGRYFVIRSSLNEPNQYGFQIPPTNESEDDACWLEENELICKYQYPDRVKLYNLLFELLNIFFLLLGYTI